MKIFHQSGHNDKWNLDSYQKFGIGDGIILSPVHTKCDTVEGYSIELKRKCIFDPQFYVPDSQKNKINTYSFFPEKLLNGFTTNDFEASAHLSAELCLSFQVRNEFEFLVIPARYHEQLATNFIEKQKAFTVDPFLAELSKLKNKKKIFLTLPLTVSMLLDVKFRLKILNWITSYPELYGIYLLVQFDEDTKQVLDFKKLAAYLSFIEEVTASGLQIICGYCNTEGLLLSAFGVYGATIGAYENTRHFSIDKFIVDDSDVRGPAPRIYLPNLLNWVRYNTLVEIREDHPSLWDKIYTPTTHSESVFLSGKPHFTQPALYHHHFELIFAQYTSLNKLVRNEDRISELKNMVSSALNLYEEVERAGVRFFDQNCQNGHLVMWNRLLNRIGKPLSG